MKKISILFSALFAINNLTIAQTQIAAGNVSGTWTLVNSPYEVNGDITIPSTFSLTIEPGVTVKFKGSYKLSVQGNIQAVGNANNKILFTINDTTKISKMTTDSGGWHGIRFDNTPLVNDSSRFAYCIMEYSKSRSNYTYDRDGGAIMVRGFSKVIFTYTTLRNNYSDDYGGAMYFEQCAPTIDSCIIENNYATNQAGGIYYSTSVDAKLRNSIIKNNKAGVTGGGICTYNSSTKITNSIISGNIAGSGGGLYLRGSNPVLSNNKICNNIATGSGGGGMYVYNNSMTAFNNIICNNTSTQDGGAIYFFSNTTPTFVNNTICNNKTTRYGGGLYLQSNSDPAFINSIIYGNISLSLGNQMYLFDNASAPDFLYCDVEGDSSAFGLKNGVTYQGNYSNNIDTIPYFTNATTGAGNNFSGLTADWKLLISSSCINSGNPDSTAFTHLSKDLAGNQRILNDTIDIGAYETNLNTLPTSTGIEKNFVVNAVAIYPNPNNGVFTIKSKLKIANIEVINVLGATVWSQQIDTNIAIIDIRKESNGIYTVKIVGEKGLSIEKIIVAK